MHKDNKNEYNRIVSSLSSALGDEIINALIENSVDEIMLNPDGRMYIRYADGSFYCQGKFDEYKAHIIVRTIATLNKKDIDISSPIIEGEIDFLNARFSALLPPLTKAPCFCMRSLHALNLPYSKLLEQGFITSAQSEAIIGLLKQKSNILICGQTGCGKTSFINSLLGEISAMTPSCRIVCIEDTPELKPWGDNVVNLYTSGKTTMSDLLKASLRLSPDRIVIGEGRSVEALDMVDALSTGHSGGLASLHAGTVEQCLERLKLMISRNSCAPENIDALVSLAIDAVIVLERSPVRRVKTVAKIKGFANNNYLYEILGE